MSCKRTLNLTSPENTDQKNCKKRLYCQNMSSADTSNTQDVFSWNKLCSLLDDKLKDVARKSDLVDLKAEMEEIKKENLQLKNDLKKLSSRLEFVDRNARSTNIIVSGLSCNNVNAVKAEFLNLCTKVLKVNTNVMSTRMLASGKSVCFTLESRMQAANVISAKKELKGQAIYLQKDYTAVEQNVRYNMRQISKKISKSCTNIKVRLGEFCIYINNKKYTWSNGKVIANTNSDAEFLNSLLAKCNYPMEIHVKEVQANAIANTDLSYTQ